MKTDFNVIYLGLIWSIIKVFSKGMEIKGTIEGKNGFYCSVWVSGLPVVRLSRSIIKVLQ